MKPYYFESESFLYISKSFKLIFVQKWVSDNPGQNRWDTDAKMTYFSLSPLPRVQGCSNHAFSQSTLLGGRGQTKIVSNNNTPKLYFRIRLRLCVMIPVFRSVPRCFGQDCLKTGFTENCKILPLRVVLSR